MTKNEINTLKQEELYKKLWDIANESRGSLAPYDLKDYILPLLCFRYLSEKFQKCIKEELKNDSATTFSQVEKNAKFKQKIVEKKGFFLKEKHWWTSLYREAKARTFEISNLKSAFDDISESTVDEKYKEVFNDLFNNIDLYNQKIGLYSSDRDIFLGRLIIKINNVCPFDSDCSFVLGDAYIYLLGQFAAASGKKAGEFYTPDTIANLLAKLVTTENTPVRDIYDPTGGSGSLLLSVRKELKNKAENKINSITLYSQEKNYSTYNLARMNMILHDIPLESFDIKNGDTLENPLHKEKKFDIIVANPPYSLKWSSDIKFLKDERFSNYGGQLAPQSCADFAFVQHMIYHLKDDGVIAVVLPQGFLFRQNSKGERQIRQKIVENNYVDTVIKLSNDFFFGTNTATCILVLKKCKKNDQVLFIDASQEYLTHGKRGSFSEKHIEKILNVFRKRENIIDYSYNASLEEIKKNNYELSLSRYIERTKEKETINIKIVEKNIHNLGKKKEELTNKINLFLDELRNKKDVK